MKKLLSIVMVSHLLACQGAVQNENLEFKRPISSFKPSAQISKENPTLETQSSAIQGGMIDENQTNVVGLVLQVAGGIGSCSGSLIAPNLILTARHCVSPTPEAIQCGVADFGTTYSARAVYVTTETNFPQWGYYQVSEVVVQNDTEVCGNDVAMLILSESIPQSEAPILIPRLDQPVMAGEKFKAVGYGHIGDGTGAGTRRSISDRDVLCIGYQNGCQDGNQAIYPNEWVGNNGTCQGDSGGPALDINGEVIGVLSRGADGCDYPTYSDPSYFADFIRDTARRAATLGGYATPAWVDGVAGTPPPDDDVDSVPNVLDNCPSVYNPSQIDADFDDIGDLCDDIVSLKRGGACSVCDGCTDDSQCGADGGVCLKFNPSANRGICSYACQGDYECPNKPSYPGGSRSICVDIGDGSKYCLNDSIYTENLCPSDYICGGTSYLTTVADDGKCHVCEPCAASTDCASGVCANFNGVMACSISCESDAECLNDTVCADVNGQKLCVNPDYQSAGYCPNTYRCEKGEVPVEQAGMMAGTTAGTTAGVTAGTVGGAVGGVVGGDIGGEAGATAVVLKEGNAKSSSCEQNQSSTSVLMMLMVLMGIWVQRNKRMI